MRKVLHLFVLLIVIQTATYAQRPMSNSNIDSSFRVTVKTPQFNSGLAYLCYHLGKNLNIEDSAYVNNKGVVVFSGNRILPGGIYAFVFPGKRMWMDFFINGDRFIDIEIKDTANLPQSKITGADDNRLFFDYQNFIQVKGKEIEVERNAYNASITKKDSLKHEAKFTKLNKELSNFRDSIIKKNPESLMTLFLNAMKEPEIINKSPKTRQDTIDNYNYYKSHYWDGVTFMDSRIIRTPFFLNRLEHYYTELLPQAPDSIIKDLDYKLLLARSSPEMYKFLLNWFTDQYLYPKYMGQDAILVHLFEKYHSKGVSSWLNEKQQKIISDRAYMVMSNLIGASAANLEMVNPDGVLKPLYNLEANYTVVIFWDPTCGHCKEEVPKIDSVYRNSWKANGVRIYSVLSENERKKEWVNYIQEHHIEDWTNVYETPEMEQRVIDAKQPGFKQLFDVTQTPTLFLLDKDKRIIAKKLTWSQINDFLNTKRGEKK
jgi:thiol-disulfide isomerase/thioredoxin